MEPTPIACLAAVPKGGAPAVGRRFNVDFRWRRNVAYAILVAAAMTGAGTSHVGASDDAPEPARVGPDRGDTPRLSGETPHDSGASTEPESTGTTPSGQEWLDALAKGYTRAQKRQKPILVRAGSETCPYCKLLAEEIAKRQVQEELGRWTLVSIDVDTSPDDARLLRVGPIPALRLLTPRGKLVAGADGAMPAEKLLQWLRENYEAAAAVPPQELTKEGPPTLIDVVRIVREFDERDATLREAAVGRLMPYPDVAAVPVVGAFAEGSLSTRLAALELLQQWGAPVEEVDPWQPETVTDERLEKLSEWASRPEPKPTPDSSKADELSAEDLAEARQSIARMLDAEPAEARAIRERLARLGPGLLPEVYRLLEQAEADEPRRRLTALRYRLVAADRLVLVWPGGLERLASGDVEARAQAADELARRATEAEEPLLLELFSDPAPLVREISLQALQRVGGSRADSALVKLLDDPEPNVRAAVLKQLAEAPSPSLVPKIAEYIETETDADLIVHAVRLLREAEGDTAVRALMKVLDHESWQVRAEAAEGIGKLAGRYSGVSQSVKADAYVALVKLLKDEDGFVVSRAVTALTGADLIAAVDPLAQAAEDHPELADEVIEALAQGEKQRRSAVPHLRRFAKHQNPRVRAAAVKGLALLGDNSKDQLQAALEDEDAAVRIAAAEGLYQLLESRRLGVDAAGALSGGTLISPAEEKGLLNRVFDIFGGSSEPAVKEPAPEMEKGDKTDAADKDSRLTRIRKGEYFPAWQHEMAGLLKPMLAAEEAKERLAAALPLAALGHDEPALPVLRETVEEHPQHVAAVAGALPWLLWKDRKLLFDQIVAKSPNPQTLQVAATSMAAVPDRRAADSLWGLLKRDEADQTTAGIVHFALTRLYFSENPYDASQASLSARKRASEDLAPRATGGPRWQRLTALALLLSFDREKAGELARQALEEPLLDATRQADAFQIDLLSSATAAEAGRKAAEAIQSENLQIRKRALKYLTAGAQSLAAIGDHSFILPVDGALMEQGSAYSYSMRPILPQPPAGVKAEPLLPLLEDDDPLVAAQAGYLLVLLDRQEGLEPLLDYWRQRGPGTPELDRLLYRAVAYLDDDSYLPLLERIYEAADKEGYNASLPEFYWTIRSMTSRNVLRFRKRIREEVGMEKLQ